MVLEKIDSTTETAISGQSWPYYNEDEIEAVVNVLRSGRVNQWTGHLVNNFAAQTAARIGVPHGLALANGSVALELALRALGIGAGDEVIVPSRSFVASASCVPLVGATPVFADVDRDSQNITPETITSVLSEKSKVIIAVHLAGWPCDMPAIMDLARSHNLFVIEDCAQAMGAEISGRALGSFGDAAAFSFCRDKIISTGGEGGMLLVKSSEHFERAWSFKDHGKDFIASQNVSTADNFPYIHTSIGTNLRMTEIQAAIGLVQLSKLDDWLDKRKRNAKIWADELSKSPALRIPMPTEGVNHAFYKFYAFLRPEQLKPGSNRNAVLKKLQSAGINAYVGSCPEIYKEKAFADLNVETRPVAHELGEHSLMFEVHPTLDPDLLRQTARHACEIITEFTKS